MLYRTLQKTIFAGRILISKLPLHNFILNDPHANQDQFQMNG